MTFLYILVGIVVVVGLWLVATYNRFITLINRTKEAWADIDVQLKRRYDLIPNLVDTVKGYARHEQGAFESVTKARAAAMSAGGAEAKGKAENMLTDALKSIFAIAEAYPDLKANQNFMMLQSELSDTENKIQSARRFYNGNVQDLKTSVEQFPSNVVAGWFNFKAMEFFELTDNHAAREPVKVAF